MSSPRHVWLATRTQEAYAILSRSWPVLHSDLDGARTANAALAMELLSQGWANPEDPVLLGKLREIIRRTTLVQTLCRSLQIVKHIPLPTQQGAVGEQPYLQLVENVASGACYLLNIIGASLYVPPFAEDPQAPALVLQQVRLSVRLTVCRLQVADHCPTRCLSDVLTC